MPSIPEQQQQKESMGKRRKKRIDETRPDIQYVEQRTEQNTCSLPIIMRKYITRVVYQLE